MKRLRDQAMALRSQLIPRGVTARPIHPNDAGLIHAMHRRLSSESVY